MLLQVDTSDMRLLALQGAEPKRDWESKTQRTTPDGTPLWVISAVAIGPNADVLKVTVPGASAPAIVPGSPVEFAGLKAGAYVSNGGREARFYYVADTVTAKAVAR